MAAKRIGAFIAAIVLIVGAIILRQHWDSNTTTAPGDSTPTNATGPVVLTCASDFEDVCAEVGKKDPSVTIKSESYRSTLDTVQKGGPAPTFWLTIEPLAGAANLDQSVPIVESQLVAVTRSPTSFTDCLQGSAKWRCIGDLAVTSKAVPGHIDPRTSVVGLAVMGALTSGFLQRVDASPADDLEDYKTWITAFERSINQPNLFVSKSAVESLGTRSTFQIALTTKADYNANAGEQRPNFHVDAPTPVAKVRVVLAFAANSSPPTKLVSELTAELKNAGWDQPTGGPTGLPTNPQLFSTLPTYGGLK
jgi:hypothetical protein